MYHFLHDALHSLKKNQIIIAEDISDSGQKQFYVGTILELNTKYESLSAKHWYECLVENKPSRIFLDVESSQPVDINAIVETLKQCIEQHYKQSVQIELMDSSSPTKYSWHIICTNIFLRNVYHVGAFVRRMVLFMGSGELRNAIDTAVYTKNRMFRINGSSKFSSKRLLKHTKPWYQLMVQPSEVSTIFECLEIDNIEPVSTSMAPENMFIQTGPTTWKRTRSQCHKGQVSQNSCPLLSPILDWLDSNLEANTCRQNTKMTESGHYWIMTRSKKCKIAHREHKGNNIWFDIDITRQLVIQRCFDEECCQSSEECVVDVPVETWVKWVTTWSECSTKFRRPSNQRNEITLYKKTF